MKKWKFTAAQCRKDYVRYENYKRAYNYECRKDWRALKFKNQRQLWLQLHGWVEDAIYQQSTLNKTNWNFW